MGDGRIVCEGIPFSNPFCVRKAEKMAILLKRVRFEDKDKIHDLTRGFVQERKGSGDLRVISLVKREIALIP